VVVRSAIFALLITIWSFLLPAPKGACTYSSALQDSDVAENFRCSDQIYALFPITEGEKYGYIDKNGVVIVKPQFDQARKFSEGMGAVCVGDICRWPDDGLWGYIDVKGVEVIHPQFLRAEAFQDGLAVVESDQGWGYIDRTGIFVIGPGDLLPQTGFSEGIAAVEEVDPATGFGNGTYAFIDKTGKTLFEVVSENAGKFSEGYASVGNGLVDRFGSDFIGPDARIFGDFSEGMAWFTEGWIDGVNSKYGFIDKCGEEILKPLYDDARAFHGGLAAVGIGDPGERFDVPGDQRWGYIDASGKVAIDLKFTLAWDFNDGLAPVYVGGRWDYGGGYRVVDGKWGYIDNTGKLVIKPQFELARIYDSGLAKVLFKSEYTDHDVSSWGYIDTKGKVIWSGKGNFFNACYPSSWGPAGWM
jgi:hypothetical protein